MKRRQLNATPSVDLFTDFRVTLLKELQMAPRPHQKSLYFKHSLLKSRAEYLFKMKC